MFFPISNSHISPLYLVVVGFLIGVMGGFFGVGGSFIAGPALRAVGLDWNFAVGTDLAHIVGKSVVAAKRHRALGNVDLRLGFIMAIGSWRSIAPAFAAPVPLHWNDSRLTAAWLGHSTVLINFFGATILTDPVLFPRIGIRLGNLTIGPKRLTKPALKWNELPPIDLIRLSHAHFDHFDMRTLHCFSNRTAVITALRTRDLLRWTRLRDVTELHWDEEKKIALPNGPLSVRAVRVNHWERECCAMFIAATTDTLSNATGAASFSAATRHLPMRLRDCVMTVHMIWRS